MRLKAFICAVIILAAIIFMAIDGAIEIFGAPRSTQYACNAILFT